MENVAAVRSSSPVVPSPSVLRQKGREYFVWANPTYAHYPQESIDTRDSMN
jgi:hypothetical protein